MRPHRHGDVGIRAKFWLARALSHLNSAYVLIQAAPNSVSSSRISPTATTRTCSGSWPPNLNPHLEFKSSCLQVHTELLGTRVDGQAGGIHKPSHGAAGGLRNLFFSVRGPGAAGIGLTWFFEAKLAPRQFGFCAPAAFKRRIMSRDSNYGAPIYIFGSY